VKEMSAYLKLIFAVTISSIIFFSCSKNPAAPNDNGFVLRKIKLKYENICTLPNYGGQTMMISNYDNFIIVSGNRYIQKYDTLAKTWQIRTINDDSIAARWDGAFCRIGTSMYLFGPAVRFDKLEWYKVVKLDPNTLTTVRLEERLPINSYNPYPAYTVHMNKMIAVYPGLDSVYVFDGSTEKGKFVAPNILKYIANTGELLFYSGQYNNFFYVFNPATLQFARLNLSDYSWNLIPISNEIARLIWSNETDFNISGGVTNNLLVVIQNRKAYCCNLDTYEWFEANNDIQLTDWWVESVSQSGNSFYFNAWLSGKIWKITKTE
jgi:hypothetical protein